MTKVYLLFDAPVEVTDELIKEEVKKQYDDKVDMESYDIIDCTFAPHPKTQADGVKQCPAYGLLVNMQLRGEQ